MWCLKPGGTRHSSRGRPEVRMGLAFASLWPTDPPPCPPVTIFKTMAHHFRQRRVFACTWIIPLAILWLSPGAATSQLLECYEERIPSAIPLPWDDPGSGSVQWLILGDSIWAALHRVDREVWVIDLGRIREDDIAVIWREPVQTPGGLGVIGDTVWVYDRGIEAFLLLPSAPGQADTFQVPSRRLRPYQPRMRPAALLPKREILYTSPVVPLAVGRGLLRFQNLVRSPDPDGAGEPTEVARLTLANRNTVHLVLTRTQRSR